MGSSSKPFFFMQQGPQYPILFNLFTRTSNRKLSWINDIFELTSPLEARGLYYYNNNKVIRISSLAINRLPVLYLWNSTNSIFHVSVINRSSDSTFEPSLILIINKNATLRDFLFLFSRLLHWFLAEYILHFDTYYYLFYKLHYYRSYAYNNRVTLLHEGRSEPKRRCNLDL